MKYITFSIGDAGAPRLGVVDGDRVIDVRAIDQGAPTSLFDLIGGGPGDVADMIFPVDTLIESLSCGLTLEAGDIIATGTPEAVGFARTPPEFPQNGDIMETEVEGIGMIRNRIVAHG